MKYSCSYFPKGQALSNPLLGDLILTSSNHWTSYFIRFGQSLRFTGKNAPFAKWNHAAIVVEPDGTLVEALGGGVKYSPLTNYNKRDYIVVRVNATDEDRNQMVASAKKAVGKKYGWITIISLGLSLLTGLKLNFGIDDQFICSGLVAKSLEKGWDDFDKPTMYMTPADLAKFYNALPSQVTT